MPPHVQPICSGGPISITGVRYSRGLRGAATSAASERQAGTAQEAQLLSEVGRNHWILIFRSSASPEVIGQGSRARRCSKIVRRSAFDERAQVGDQVRDRGYLPKAAMRNEIKEFLHIDVAKARSSAQVLITVKLKNFCLDRHRGLQIPLDSLRLVS